MPSKVLSGGAALEAKLKEITAKVKKAASVNVGFLEGATYPDGTPVAYVASLNEFGTEDIPARPFFRGTIKEKSPEWPAALGNLLVQNNYDASVALGQMGEGIKGQIQQSIKNFSTPPNAASTIAKKGFDKALIDTGSMLRAVDYEVKS